MRLIICCVVYCIACLLQTQAQQRVAVNFAIKLDTVKIRQYTIQPEKDTAIHTLFAQFEFNEAYIKNTKEIIALNDGLTQIISIDYVFSQQSDKNAQHQLDQRRFLELYLQAPFIFQQSMIKWKAYEQLGFTTPKDAAKLMHGFVLKYKKIEPFLTQDPTTIKRALRKRMQRPVDSTIYKIINRHPHWEKSVVVADFTCSMSPYFLEVMSWFCLHEFKKKKSYFAFFNDGDGKPNNLKTIGNTGGVHTFRTNDMDTVVYYIAETIKHGCSGDEPENDVEAILLAMNDNPDCKEIILVADNWSDIRDFGLRTKIKKPVRVLLCNTDYGINVQYINLALQTKGSIHTIEEDLDELYKLKVGTVFTMVGHEFMVKGGAIQLLRKL